MHATEKVLQLDQLLLMRAKAWVIKNPNDQRSGLARSSSLSFLPCQHQFHSADHHSAGHSYSCNLFVSRVAEI